MPQCVKNWEACKRWLNRRAAQHLKTQAVDGANSDPSALARAACRWGEAGIAFGRKSTVEDLANDRASVRPHGSHGRSRPN